MAKPGALIGQQMGRHLCMNEFIFCSNRTGMSLTKSVGDVTCQSLLALLA